jgi:cellulose synthase/poly-beta-1,6-N-acetylglucosamine synthase-like glycosyltransferase
VSFSNKLVRAASYFPLRYYLAGTFFAFVLLNSLGLIKSIEGYMITNALNYLNIPSFLSQGKLFVGGVSDAIQTRFPIELQVAFLSFFLTIATVVRTSFAKRVATLCFGVLCFLTFILTEFLLLVIFYELGIIQSVWSLRAAALSLTILLGGLMVHLTLFSLVLIPSRTKIRPTIMRNYTRQYLYFAAVLTLTGLMLFSFEAFVNPDIYSPLALFLNVYLWLRLSSIINISYWVANLTRELISRCLGRDKGNKSETLGVTKPLSLSFLIPAYNEEKLVGGCIESIDRAAANYSGKVEIILVNDGSTDNTEKVVSNAFQNLKHAYGRLFTLPNSGKGFALAYGLEKTTGEVVFRTDADSIIDENALSPMMKHFADPKVGSVCGWVYPLPENKGMWANAQRVMCAKAAYIKMAQAEFDSLLVMPGSTAAFRREALIQAGGWTDNIFGEDGEITNKVARYGYRGVYEPASIVYSEHPETLRGVLQQRARWGVAFYHSRGRNWRLAREFHTPRSIFFLWDLMTHGAVFGRSLLVPLMAALLITAALDLSSPIRSVYHLVSESMIPWLIIAKIVAIHAFLTTLQLGLFGYRLRIVKQVSVLKYWPIMRLMHMIITLIVRPLVVNVLLSWSSRWKEYNTQSFKDLRRVVNRSIDPLYPSGEQQPATSSSNDVKSVLPTTPSSSSGNAG